MKTQSDLAFTSEIFESLDNQFATSKAGRIISPEESSPNANLRLNENHEIKGNQELPWENEHAVTEQEETH